MNEIIEVALSNNPPLAELLAEETAALRARANALIANVPASRIDSAETAAAVTQLAGMLRDHRARSEAARRDRIAPIDEQRSQVQHAFARLIIDPLDGAMDACRKMLDAWREKLAAEAAAERRQRDSEIAAAKRAAEEAERKRQEAESVGDTGAAIRAEMESLQAAERAEKLASDADTIRPDAMIRTQAGSAGTVTRVSGKIENVGLCLAWMIRNDSNWLSAALQPRVDTLTRTGMTVDGVARVEESTTRFRR